MSYKCQVCGYVLEGDINEQPADYECPVCGAGKDRFEEEK